MILPEKHDRIPSFHATHWVASALGLIAGLLTITGVYDVVAYVVAQRPRVHLVQTRGASQSGRGLARRLLIRAPADKTSAKMIPDSRYAALTRSIFLTSVACGECS
jgi:hypothetical protein